MEELCYFHYKILILLSKYGRCNARWKIPAMDSTSSTAIAGTFLLAEAGALLYAQMPYFHNKITLGFYNSVYAM